MTGCSQTSLKDKLATFAVLSSIFVILWGARLAFIYLVSDHWFGTLGITSLILGTITYLSWKERLGIYGKTYKKALLHKLVKKFTVFRIVSGIFFILVFSAFSAGMHYSVSDYQAETKSMIREIKNTQGDDYLTTDSVITETRQKFDENPFLYVVAFLSMFIVIPYVIITDFPTWAVLMGIVNEVLGKQFIHLIDILLIEQVEIFGILLFVHYIQRKTKTLPSNKV